MVTHSPAKAKAKAQAKSAPPPASKTPSKNGKQTPEKSPPVQPQRGRLMMNDDSIDARQLLRALRLMAKGDFNVRLPLDLTGMDGELAEAFNNAVDLNDRLSLELERISMVVGKEGRITQRASLGEATGSWAACIENVNTLVGDLVRPTTEVARVIGAVAKGDLNQTMALEIEGGPLKGEFLRTAKTINTMVEQLSSFTSEVTRVAREVGTEGKLGGQAQVKGVSGTWKDLTDNVNSMASNLTAQVRNIADVTTAVATGDLSRKITVDVKGEILELKKTINTMVDQLSSFASEVTRVAREVGTEGKLGGQAQVKGVGGTWKDLTDSVNYMASNLTSQVRNIAEVTTAVATGDLSKKITVDVKGEILELKNTINTMVDQLGSFAAEVTRVAREVGTEGKLGGQADVRGVSGTWKDLTDSVNYMASNLTSQVRNIADVTTAVARGDLSKKITVDVKGEILELKNTINTMVDQLSSFAAEVTRVAREVGTEGKLGGQADVQGVTGAWKGLTDNVNLMASNLTGQVRNIAEVTTAVAKGDLSKKITVDVKGEILELKNTINTMVDQLTSFASEVTRVAREVGTEGKLGGQADVKGVSGTWKDLTDSVNGMASNLTEQVRGIAGVVTAVAQGNLKRTLVLQAKGEIASLADTINEMIDTLATFADEVTSVAREVGVEGVLGGQALVPGAAGTWRDLTDNVNGLAANLTTQVRAIAEVATAVTKGDLTRSIDVEALGEVAALKDNINEMIRNLKDTTQKNTEQDWLKTNLAKFTNMLQGQREMITVANLILSEVAPLVGAQHGLFYINGEEDGEPMLSLLGSYAFQKRKHLSEKYRMREGSIGQCALEKQRILIVDAPRDYIVISSGLGEAAPVNIVALPVLFEGEVKAVIELASFQPFSETHLAFLDQLTESIGIVLNTIEANMRTENLLMKSQSLAQELQAQQQELTETNKRLEQQAKTLQASEDLLTQQQQELQQTNEELEDKAKLLALQNAEVERKNREIEQARLSLEEKAEQLALTSKYKSEFLANMSHELRTPLNSLLILSKLLTDNPDGNLSGKQVEFAKTIHDSGSDLLALINDILDLSKIESGTISIDVGEFYISDLVEGLDRIFRQIAESNELEFKIEVDPAAPKTVKTDSKRLQQVLKNLLSNAFKFTENGGVTLKIKPVKDGWDHGRTSLNQADTVLAFSVVDTGIGIAPEKQKIIFEAFQQADGSTSRKYGGTGLGLPISREISTLLGGEIKVVSAPDEGSTFSLYLPQAYSEPPARPHAFTTAVSEFRLKDGIAGAETTPAAVADTSHLLESAVADDRGSLQDNDRVLLIVEDDLQFARLLLDEVRDHGFKGIVAATGEAALALATRFGPDAITLDLRLPDMDGWAVLDRLKHDSKTRHIPVHVISALDQPQRAYRQGGIGYMEKPVTREALGTALHDIRNFIERPAKSLLIIEDDETQRRNITELLGDGDIESVAVSSGGEALELLHAQHFDCIVLDPDLPDMRGADLIKSIQDQFREKNLPIVVYSARELSREEEVELKKFEKSLIVKEAPTLDRLLDETALFLHRVAAKLPDTKQRMIEQSHAHDLILSGRKILVVDDDVRNIFALTSILETQKMRVIYAQNGYEAIQSLEDNHDVDIVLMDVMMPEMDGYETMRRIRKVNKYRTLPIIALTAKAMKGDREKCIEAGASDYIAKPVHTEQLKSLLRVWLYH